PLRLRRPDRRRVRLLRLLVGHLALRIRSALLLLGHLALRIRSALLLLGLSPGALRLSCLVLRGQLRLPGGLCLRRRLGLRLLRMLGLRLRVALRLRGRRGLTLSLGLRLPRLPALDESDVPLPLGVGGAVLRLVALLERVVRDRGHRGQSSDCDGDDSDEPMVPPPRRRPLFLDLLLGEEARPPREDRVG